MGLTLVFASAGEESINVGLEVLNLHASTNEDLRAYSLVNLQA
jgi:hypothetical protein